ncbi:MAG: BatA domain-containing protein [Verrucomicrobiae bacterium]|nr:BatA domain-containing protein [Verrucomicrobiae bacterium]
MSFLQPILLAALPLAALPVIIHLIHLHRRRTVPWAAMMFLAAAQRMNRGYSRLRRWLILAFRVIAVAAIILTAARPLAGGLLGLTGGAPDTVIVLFDRSASMEQQNLATGLSKRQAGLKQLTEGMRDAYRGRSRVVLIDSATTEPLNVEKPEAIAELPSTWATDTAADIPSLMQAALDYITTNQTGRTDIWVLSDLQQADWDASGGRWEPLRQGFAELPGVRFHLLCYPQPPEDNLSVTVTRVARRESRDKAEVVLDLDVSRPLPTAGNEPLELPIRLVVNGTASVHKAEFRDNRLTLSGHAIPIDKSLKRGWGRVELPADSQGEDNVWHFVFDEPPVLKTAIVTDDPLAMASIQAALESPADSDRSYAVSLLEPGRAAEIDWEATALVVWQAPIPGPDELVARQLRDHVAAGRTLLLLPPDTVGSESFQGVAWGDWKLMEGADPALVSWWRNDSGPLANTRDGAALPVGEVEIRRYRALIPAEGHPQPLPLARVGEIDPLLVRATPDDAANATSSGAVYFLATLPGTEASSLARDGVVLFAFLHRSLDAASGSLGSARQREAGAGVLGGTDAAQTWKRLAEANPEDSATPLPSPLLPLRAGILTQGDRLLALNRPAPEDLPGVLSTASLEELFAGLDHRIIEDQLQDQQSLASEIWRTFLILMASALILEALLSMPPRRAPAPAASSQPSA